MNTLLCLTVRSQLDVVQARRRAREVATALGYAVGIQTRIATAVSEVVRNAFEYAGGGQVEFRVESGPPPVLVVEVSDHGPGIAQLETILAGRYVSPTGLSRGIIGARRLVDRFEIRSSATEGTVVLLAQVLPRQWSDGALKELADELVGRDPRNPFEEVQLQNQELLRALEELNERQAELIRLNRELEDTNRGVIALYAELNEKADSLAQVNELKTTFLSNMSHEFRTPLTAILSLSGLLIDGVDGELNTEQQKQAGFIRQSAQGLSDLVDDLLDLARVEAGRVNIYPSEFWVESLFGALRGMLRPLLAHNSSVRLTFDEPPALLMHTDEGKVAQVLRNLISNALKFTERGEVRVGIRPARGNQVVFFVSDTGIGIAANDQERIFDEYVQLDSPLQRRLRGTGLGLPLARKLVQFLGGRLWLESEPEKGSTFYAEIPLVHPDVEEAIPSPPVVSSANPLVLAVEDNFETLLLYKKYLAGTGFDLLSARTLAEARQFLRQTRPVAVVLDVLLGGASTWELLQQIKQNESTCQIPVIVATVVNNSSRAKALGADDFCMKPIEREWLLERLRRWVDG